LLDSSYAEIRILKTGENVDEFVWNDEWAATAQTSMECINQLELSMLDDLNWDMMITPEEFDTAVQSLEHGVAVTSSKTSGFFSYTDVNVLVSELRPYLDHVKRFLVLNATVTSAYLVFIAATFGAVAGVSKVVESIRSTKSDVASDAVDVSPALAISEPIITTSELADLSMLHSLENLSASNHIESPVSFPTKWTSEHVEHGKNWDWSHSGRAGSRQTYSANIRVFPHITVH